MTMNKKLYAEERTLMLQSFVLDTELSVGEGFSCDFWIETVHNQNSNIPFNARVRLTLAQVLRIRDQFVKATKGIGK
jgi:hypothetical protein